MSKLRQKQTRHLIESATARIGKIVGRMNVAVELGVIKKQDIDWFIAEMEKAISELRKAKE